MNLSLSGHAGTGVGLRLDFRLDPLEAGSLVIRRK